MNESREASCGLKCMENVIIYLAVTWLRVFIDGLQQTSAMTVTVSMLAASTLSFYQCASLRIGSLSIQTFKKLIWFSRQLIEDAPWMKQIPEVDTDKHAMGPQASILTTERILANRFVRTQLQTVSDVDLFARIALVHPHAGPRKPWDAPSWGYQRHRTFP